MRLLSIAAKNYRTLENTTINFASHYCTISGKNNAGKSAVIRLISTLFRNKRTPFWAPESARFDYKRDKTQWIKSQEPIRIEYALELTRDSDLALVSFIEKIASVSIEHELTRLEVCYTITDSGTILVSTSNDGKSHDEKASKEIEKRIQDSNILFLYNSTTMEDPYTYGPGGSAYYEFVLSQEERRFIDEAEKQAGKSMKRLAKRHTESLAKIFGRLSERYEVELSPLEGMPNTRMPLGIRLKDRNVGVPLNDWGSGTQNKTQILMAIIQANRIKTGAQSDDKITPFVIIEEPESFLHPAAQSEFGRILGSLSSEYGIQLIVTTHSPHMLNLSEPSANILLSREIKRNTPCKTVVVDTVGENWMAPFSEHLGLPQNEFNSLRQIFSSQKSKVLLVEGEIDREYFDLFQKREIAGVRLNEEIEIVSYGGKDTLKNTALIKFVLSKFDKVYLTYDLDADSEVRASLNRIGLKIGSDFTALGSSSAGKDCIEGLLPKRILDVVNGRETDLIMKLGSRDSNDRRKAKDTLKKMYLHEFKLAEGLTKDEIKDFARAIKLINSQLGDSKTVVNICASAEEAC